MPHIDAKPLSDAAVEAVEKVEIANDDYDAMLEGRQVAIVAIRTFNQLRDKFIASHTAAVAAVTATGTVADDIAAAHQNDVTLPAIPDPEQSGEVPSEPIADAVRRLAGGSRRKR